MFNSGRGFYKIWAELDLNQRRRTSADLQSAPINHSGIDPITFVPGVFAIETTTVALAATVSHQLHKGHKRFVQSIVPHTALKNNCRIDPSKKILFVVSF